MRFTAARGDDTVDAGAGTDEIYGEAGNDTIHGGAGDDIIDGGAGSGFLFGDEGNDELHAGLAGGEMHGGAGDDILYGSEVVDIAYGDAGNDRVLGYGGNDWLSGGSDEDILDGGAGDDTILGDGGGDLLLGGPGSDTLYGNNPSGGDDLAVDYGYGDFGTGLNEAGSGNDLLYGSALDLLFGEGGVNTLNTSNGGNPADLVPPTLTPAAAESAASADPLAVNTLPEGPVYRGWWGEIAGSATGSGITGGLGSALDPAVAVDSTGTRSVAWADSRNGQTEIYVARQTGAGWEMLGRKRPVWRRERDNGQFAAPLPGSRCGQCPGGGVGRDDGFGNRHPPGAIRQRIRDLDGNRQLPLRRRHQPERDRRPAATGRNGGRIGSLLA